MARRNNKNRRQRRRNGLITGQAGAGISGGQVMTQAARPVPCPKDPPQGTVSVAQRIRLTSSQSVTASTGSTFTITNVLGSASPSLPAGYNVKIQRVMIYFPSSGGGATPSYVEAEFVYVVTDLLPNNDGLVITDSGTIGSERARVSYQPTHLDRLSTFYENSTQALFSWTSSAAVTGTIMIIVDVIARVF
jgi:hypothetical protein